MSYNTNGSIPTPVKDLQMLPTVTDLSENLEHLETTPKIPKLTDAKKKTYNNKTVLFNLDIDAGAKNVKARLNGDFKSFPSVAKVIDGDVPLRDLGCFTYGKKSYVVGKAIERVNGVSIVSSDDNKLERLDIWILGAIAHFRKDLKSAVMIRRRKTEPVQIILNLRIMTLSSIKRKELDKALKAIKSFSWDDSDFEITVKNLEFINEAHGAALEVAHTHNIEEFKLLDLGGGTLTYSEAFWNGDEVSTSQQPISGGGMVGITNLISTALSRTDRGALGFEALDIQLALETSKIKDGVWSVPMRSNGKFIDISSEVRGALDDWLRKNHTVKTLFDRVSQDLARGQYVFCTGGGFAIAVISVWIIRYLSDGIEDSKISLLPNPEKINMSGLVWSDVKEVVKEKKKKVVKEKVVENDDGNDANKGDKND